MINNLRVVVLVVVCLLGGCAAPAPPAASPAIDWARAPVVLVQLTVAAFRPGVVMLRAGQPVRLVFENNGVGTHDFVTNLFTSVATRAGTGPGTRPGGVRVILQVADRVEYDIVPQVPGTYPLESVMYEPAGGFPPAHFEVR
jgi:hypothetical protein